MKINEIYRQTIISLLSKMLITIIGFFATVYFAHTVGPSILGLYFIFLAYYGIFDLMSDGGFGSAAIKRISEGSDRNAFFSAYTALRLGLSCISILLLFIAYQYLKNFSSPELFIWLCIGIFVSLFASISYVGVYGAGKVGIAQIGGLLQTLSQFIIQVIAIFLGFSFGGLAGGFVMGLAVQALLNYRFLTFRFVMFKKDHIRSLFSFSFWSFLSSGGSLIYAYTDTLLIAFFMSSTDVGIYRTVFQFTTIASFITLAMQVVLFPKISNWNALGEKNKIERTLGRAITFSLLLAVPICVGGWILGDRLLFYLYGTPFVAGTSSLWILLVVQVVNVFMLLFTTTLNAVNYPRESFRITMIGSIANIVLNILFIPIFGILGAAIATCCAMCINALLAFRILSRLMDLHLELNSIRNIILAALVMGIGVGAFRFFIPVSTITLVMVAVCFGTLIFTITVLKIDSGIYQETAGIIREIFSEKA
jgi:O-antigen/teichoic acid export membrane protein